MDKEDLAYFTKMSKYTPEIGEDIPESRQSYINYFTSQINKTAKEALQGKTSSDNAKDTIDEYVGLIKKVGTEGTKNVSLG